MKLVGSYTSIRQTQLQLKVGTMYKTSADLKEDKMLQEKLLSAIIANISFTDALKTVVKLEPPDKPDTG